MNDYTAIGRLTADPEIRYTQTANGQMAIGRYTLAVNRRFTREGEPDTDFIPCVAFGKNAEFVEKYLHKGMKVGIKGEIRTGTYVDQYGEKKYTWNIAVEQHDFCESAQNGSQSTPRQQAPASSSNDGFMNIPDSIDDEEMPFI